MRLLDRLLGTPGKGTVAAEDFTDRHPVRSAVIRQAAALLLSYPDERLLERLDTLVAALQEVGADLDRVRPLLAWLTERPLHEVQADYIQEYDLSRRHSLHLTYWTDGDTRRRGEALAAFKRVYRAHGCALDDSELPDYLPLVLEFAARVSPGSGYELLQRYRPSLELLRLALRDDDLPHQGAVALVCGTLPGVSPEDKQSVLAMAGYGPPTETVGLDPADPRLLPFTPTSTPTPEGTDHGRR